MAESTPLSDTAPSLGLGQLSAAEWDRLLKYIDRFEAAWEAGEAVRLNAFLPPTDDPLRAVVLDELIKADLEMRWRRKETPKLEDYVRDHAELGSPSALSSRLIFEEYRVRKQHGDRPALASYQARFPRQYEELCRLAGATPALTTDRQSAAWPAQPFLGTNSIAGGLTFGEGYRPIQRIGSGGFGEVWRAEAPGGVAVAIKIIVRPIDQAESQREREALELMKGLRHPFLLQTHAFSVLEDRLLIVMELADGSLRDRVKECRGQGLPGIPHEELLLYFREAAEALDFLHEKGIQHRDIKPDNILLLSGHAKMADFGLARLIESRLGGTSTGAGTPPYMAPECWDGRVHEQSDQYSLAITYAELRLLRRPFAARELRELMLAHLEQTPDLGDLPGPEQTVLLKALAKNPAARFGSCVEFTQALREAWLAELQRTGDSERRKRGTYGSVLPRRAPKASKTLLADLQPVATTPLNDVQGRWRQLRLLAGVAAMIIVLSGFALAWALLWPGPEQETRPQVSVPPGYQAAPEATVMDVGRGASYYSRIAAEADPSLVCVLVPRARPSDPESFYISQGKVTVGQFQRGTKAAGPSEAARNNADLPVFNVTVDDAVAFAASLGGYLPTTSQWDKAAGRFEEPRGAGPFLNPWQVGDIGVGRAKDGPLPAGQARCDRSPSGCWDMAGNGKEWTRNLEFDQQNRLVPLLQPTAKDRVELRGRSFRQRQPFTFDDTPEGEFYLDPEDATNRKRMASDDLGFRVVLELGR